METLRLKCWAVIAFYMLITHHHIVQAQGPLLPMQPTETVQQPSNTTAEPQIPPDQLTTDIGVLALSQSSPTVTDASSDAHCHHLRCQLFGRQGHCKQCRTCVRVPVTRKTTSWNYESKSVPTCLPKLKCSLFHHCQDGSCSDCARPTSKRVLIKHKVVEEVKEFEFESRPASPSQIPAAQPSQDPVCFLHGSGCLGRH